MVYARMNANSTDTAAAAAATFTLLITLRENDGSEKTAA